MPENSAVRESGSGGAGPISSFARQLAASLCLFFQFAPLAAPAVVAPEELSAVKKLINEHSCKQAEVLLSALIKRHPEDGKLHMLNGELLLELGRLDSSALEFARAAELLPADPFPLMALADVSLKQLELDMSLSCAQQAVARDPSCMPARIALVKILLQCEQTGEAERQIGYLPADEKYKDQIELLHYQLNLKKGDYYAAERDLERVIKKSGAPGAQMLLERSDLLQAIGDYEGARRELQGLVSANPDLLQARLRLARLLESQFHDYAGALHNFDEALRIDPLSAAAYSGRERCSFKRKNLALQLKLFLRDLFSSLDRTPPAEKRN